MFSAAAWKFSKGATFRARLLKVLRLICNKCCVVRFCVFKKSVPRKYIDRMNSILVLASAFLAVLCLEQIAVCVVWLFRAVCTAERGVSRRTLWIAAIGVPLAWYHHSLMMSSGHHNLHMSLKSEISEYRTSLSITETKYSKCMANLSKKH